MIEARKIVNKVVHENKEKYFGINTGVGLFSNVAIKDEEMADY